jgi:hypothetical protein
MGLLAGANNPSAALCTRRGHNLASTRAIKAMERIVGKSSTPAA